MRISLEVLNRAEHFVRSNLPDAAARRKLSAVLLQRAKLPGVGKGGVIQELVAGQQTSPGCDLCGHGKGKVETVKHIKLLFI